MRVTESLVDLQGLRERGLGGLELAEVVQIRGFEADEVGFFDGVPGALFEETPRFVEGPARAFQVGGQPSGVPQGGPGGGLEVGGELFSDLRGTEFLGDLEGEVDDVGRLHGLGVQVAAAGFEKPLVDAPGVVARIGVDRKETALGSHGFQRGPLRPAPEVLECKAQLFLIREAKRPGEDLLVGVLPG